MMSKYFTISTGLRGCYLADSAYIVRVDTRRELKAYIASEASGYREADFVGANKKAVAWLANAAWKEAHKKAPGYLPYCLQLAPPHARDNYCHGIMAGVATRAEWLEQEESE